MDRQRFTGKQPAPRDLIRKVFDELNQPSLRQLKVVLQKRGIRHTHNEIEKVVNNSGARQLYAPRVEYPGKIASTAPDTRWAADTVHMVSQPDGEFKYILVAQDIFTRELFAKALKTNTSQEVTDRFEDIIAEHGTPTELNTDEGMEFIQAAFQGLIRRKGDRPPPQDRQTRHCHFGQQDC